MSNRHTAPPRKATAIARPFGEGARLIAALWIFAAIHFYVLCLEFGPAHFQSIRPALLGLLLAAVAGTALARLPGANWQSRVWIGGTAGLALSGLQMLTIGSFVQGPWLVTSPAIITALVSLLAGTVTGAALAWSEALLTEGWGRALTFLLAGPSFALIHLGLSHSILGQTAVSSGAIAAITLCFVAVLSFVLGLKLRDTGRMASAQSVAKRNRFRLLADAFPIPVALTTADHQSVIFSNRRWDKLFKLPQASPRKDDGALPLMASVYTHAADQQRLMEIVRRHGTVENHEVEMRRCDGSTFWALASACAITIDDDEAILTGFYDISDRKSTEEALLASEVRYALISRAANDGIFDWDIPSGQVYYSARWKEIVGVDDAQRLSTIEDWFSRVHPDDLPCLRHAIEEHQAGHTSQLDTEYRLQHGEGRYCWMQCRAIALRNTSGEPIRMAGSQSDITLRKTYESNLLNAAYEDQLTGINNRAYFNQLITQHSREGSIAKAGILLINVDEFRRLNDNLGSSAGDALLIELARRLSSAAGPRDMLSRLGNDEFALWMGEVPTDTNPFLSAELLLFELEQPYAVGNVEVPVTISAGLATHEMGDAVSADDLLRNARLALDRAKQLGGGRVEPFENALLRETHLKRKLSRDLTNATRQGQISCVYQPIIKLDSRAGNAICGFESLMRWHHPELGPIPPARFIPIAEEAGLIGPLGLFAIESAAEQIAHWSRHHHLSADFAVSVNLSARQISDNAGVNRLLSALDRLELPKGRLKLEITESVLMSDPEAMVRILQQLRERGIELCLDDFGTGYSSLSYLHRFPLDWLKIDRSFVSRMTHAQEAYRLVRSIIDLAHDLGLKVVAEGVETLDEVELLRGLGCDYGQGYYFSRPLHANQAEDLLVGEAA